jgi:hypothetical protein
LKHRRHICDPNLVASHKEPFPHGRLVPSI